MNPIRSMTGFGRAEGVISDRYRAEITVRSVNHRHLEVMVRIRDDFGFLEPVIRRRAGEICRRGKVDLSVRIRSVGGAAAPKVDGDALSALWRSLGSVCQKEGLPMPESVAPLLSLPGILPSADSEEILLEPERAALDRLISTALDALEQERAREGAGLSAVLEQLGRKLSENLEVLFSRREEWVAVQAEALRTRIRTLAGESGVEVSRLDQEVAVLADRTDVTEELERLRIHLARLRDLLAGEAKTGLDAGRGKALDFLAQELGREVGTCGAKLRHPDATGAVLEMKGIVEKIREQVQNVE